MGAEVLARRRLLLLTGVAWIGGGGTAAFSQATPEVPPLPATATTPHTIQLAGSTLRFQASAGSIRLAAERGTPRAELAYAAFLLEGAEPSRRPVTFVFNGGPGFASGWLNIGAVGPWRVDLAGEAATPSASPVLIDNAETWLPFTDLVFIDPPGTGYSRVLADDARARLWSVEGDVACLAEAINRWLDRYERNVSAKYLLGESYGGFRVPRLARALAAGWGTGIAGMVLVSPKLDFGGRSAAFDPFDYVTRLPSMAATARAAQGPVTRAQLADVEHYARTDYLLDLTRGENDAAAIERRCERVAAFTGLDPSLVRRYHGLIDTNVFLREHARGRVGSIYDASVTSADPFPLETVDAAPDPVLDALKAPVSSAMAGLFRMQLNWRPETVYRLHNADATRQWDWGRTVWNPLQSMSALRTALALDPRLNVLIAHGMFDLITPYLGTQLLLDQVPEAGIGSRVQLVTYPGGHMFYLRDGPRAAFRDAAARLFDGA